MKVGGWVANAHVGWILDGRGSSPCPSGRLAKLCECSLATICYCMLPMRPCSGVSSSCLPPAGILVELPLAAFFLKRLRGAYSDINDLPTLDPELHR
jgi:hypothetical protein